MKKNSFLLYHEYYIHFKYLTTEQKGLLLDAIFEYEINNKETQLEPIVEMAFSFVKTDLDINRIKYEETCERNRANGSKGGRPKNPKNPSGLSGLNEKPKKPDNENEKIMIYENEKENEQIEIKDSDVPYLLECATFIRLSPNEINKLTDKYGDSCTKDMIGILDNWLQSDNTKAIKARDSISHYSYFRINNWVYKEYQKARSYA